MAVMKQMDKANGYMFTDNEERSIGNLLSQAVGDDFQQETIQHVQEKYVDEKS